jgi:hypothetical protein
MSENCTVEDTTDEEVETFTEPLVADEAADAADLEDLYTEGSR